MIHKIIALIKAKRSFFLYILIGFSGLTLDIIAFIFMVRVLHINEFVANTISMSVGITNNFFINAYFNFKKTDKLFTRYVSFYLVGLVGIAVSNVLLWLFNSIFGSFIDIVLGLISDVIVQYRLELVKAGTVVIIAIMQYFLNKKLSFAERK